MTFYKGEQNNKTNTERDWNLKTIKYIAEFEDEIEKKFFRYV